MATWRRARKAAAATPTSTAAIRSNATVQAAVSKQHGGVGPRRAHDGHDVVPLGHPERRHHQDAGKRSQWNPRHEPGSETDHDSSTSA